MKNSDLPSFREHKEFSLPMELVVMKSESFDDLGYQVRWKVIDENGVERTRETDIYYALGMEPAFKEFEEAIEEYITTTEFEDL